MNSTEPCTYRVSIKGIAIDDSGRFLLAKEDNGKWEMLGGGLEHGEDPLAALRREIHEETGLVVTAITPTPKYFVTSKKLLHTCYMANVIYEITLQDMDFTPSAECTELRFFSVEEARHVELFPNVEELLNVYDPRLH